MKKFLFIILMAIMPMLKVFGTDVTSVYDTKFISNSELTLDSIATYDNVYVEIPAKLQLRRTYNTIDIDINTKDSTLANLIQYKIKDNTLYIYMNTFKQDDLYNIKEDDITITLYNPKDIKIRTNRNLQIIKNDNDKKIHNSVSYENGI